MLTVVICSLVAVIILVYAVNSTVRDMNQRKNEKRLESRLASLVEELGTLKVKLSQTQRNSDTLTKLIVFFNLISMWHDREIGGFIRELSSVRGERFSRHIKVLNILETHFQNAGRNIYGWNRTRPGQLVTGRDVYLGGVWGLFTHPISHWSTQKDKPKGGWGHHDPSGYFKRRNAYDVVCDQAQDFMKSHTPKMIELIEKLQRLCSVHTSKQELAA
ncbi:MAG: hypothetical protein ABIF06_01825 [bacterium]